MFNFVFFLFCEIGGILKAKVVRIFNNKLCLENTPQGYIFYDCA